MFLSPFSMSWTQRSKTFLCTQNQSVSGVTTICLTQCNTSPSHRVDQVVDCGLWPLQSARRNRMWAFAHSSQLRWRTTVRSRPQWGRRACRWASLRRFLTVCAKFLWLCKSTVLAAVWVAGLRRSWRGGGGGGLGWCGYTWSAVVRPIGCFRVAFYCGQPKAYVCNNHAV